MNYKSFEDLPVWQAAIEFALKVFEFTEKAEKQLRGLGDTKNQLERAAISISNNIAEGFERGTNVELINFLYIARGSAGESRSMLCLCERLPRFAGVKPEINNLKSRAKNVSSQLFGWIESLKNSDARGEKYFTAKEKNKQKENEDWLEFKRELEQPLYKTLKEQDVSTNNQNWIKNNSFISRNSYGVLFVICNP